MLDTMELITAIYIVVSIVAPFILVVLLFLILMQAFTGRKPRVSYAVKRGRLAERRVKKIIQKFGEDYISFHDIYLPSTETKSGYTQLDHLVISKYGIFVIETKNYSGEIIGDSTQFYWQQRIGRKVHSFYSPVKQNELHINAIRNLSDIYYLYVPIFSIIAYAESASLRNVRVIEHDIAVTYISRLKRLIRKMDSEMISSDEVNDIVQQIEKASIKMNDI